METNEKTEGSQSRVRTNWVAIFGLLFLNGILAKALSIFMPSFIAVGGSSLIVFLVAHRFRRAYSLRKWVLFSMCYAIVITAIVYVVYRLA